MVPNLEAPTPLHLPQEEQPNAVHHSQISQPQRVFRGCDLVDWLVERGLCMGRGDAEMYGRSLQQGGVLDHVMGQHRFKDEAALLYYFTDGTQWGTEEEQSQDA